jgi:HNH endonuclease
MEPHTAHSLADAPENGILLRADIHLFFDAYQFAFHVPLVRCPMLS